MTVGIRQLAEEANWDVEERGAGDLRFKPRDGRAIAIDKPGTPRSEAVERRPRMPRPRVPKLLRTADLVAAGVTEAELEFLLRKLRAAKGEVLLSVQQLTTASHRLEHGGEMGDWVRDVGPVLYAMARRTLTHKSIRTYIDNQLRNTFRMESGEEPEPESPPRGGPRKATPKQMASIQKANAARRAKAAARRLG